ncbi:MAG: type I secretion system permease/ATPase [Terricaulis sp.]
MPSRDGSRVSNPLHDALRACRRHIGYVLGFSAAVNLLYLAPSLYMLQVYDRVLASGSLWTLVFLSFVLILCLGTLSYLDAVRGRILSALSRRLDRLVAPQLLAKGAQRPGSAPSQLLREFDTFRGALTGAPALAVIDAPWTPIYIAVGFMIHPLVGLLGIFGGAILVAIAIANEAASRDALRTHEEASAAAYALLHNDSAHSETARALGMQEALMQRQLLARETVGRAQSAAGRSGAGYLAATKFARLALQSSVLGLGAYLAIEQQITAGGMIAGSILTARAFGPLEQIVGAWRQFIQASRAYKAVRDVLGGEQDDRAFTELPAPKGALAAEHVTVRAPGGERFLLQGVSFRVEPGEIVGMIGPSGAGKTTLMRVVAGALAADAGAVRLDGAKLTDWAPGRLGRHLGYLPQDVGFFAGTVSDNIARFQRDPSGDAAIIAAAKAAGVHELILGLPKGYDTQLGAGGRGLSAGQAQRLALARALYREPALLVLDEPNAHLDAEGEIALIAALKGARERGASALVVAHRIGFMTITDKLLVLRDGRVDAFGPRDQIVAKMNSAAQRPLAIVSASEGAPA